MKQNNKKQISDFARYSGIAFQMIAIILIGAFGGLKLDKFLSLKFPIFTLLLITIAIALAIYTAIKDFIK